MKSVAGQVHFTGCMEKCWCCRRQGCFPVHSSCMPPGQVLTQPYPARCLMQMSPFCHISRTSDIHIRLCCSSLLSCSLFVNTTDGQGVTPCLPPTVWPAHKTVRLPCHLIVPSVCLPHPHNYACHHVSPCLPAQVGLYTGLYGSLTTLSALPPPPSPFLTTLCPPPLLCLPLQIGLRTGLCGSLKKFPAGSFSQSTWSLAFPAAVACSLAHTRQTLHPFW